MNKRQIYYPLIVLFASIFLHGCYEDKGNYEYETINRITVNFEHGGFLDAYMSDTLKIDPQLSFSIEEESDLSFFWYCNDNEIYTEKVLNYPVSQLSGERPYIKIKVINNRDNSTYVEGFYVEIIPDFMTGWVVLTKENDRCKLSFINPLNYSVYSDFYTLKSGSELGPDAIHIQEHWPNDAVTIGNIMVIRNSPEGNIEVEGKNLNPLYNTNDFFLAATPPNDYRSVGEYYMWDYSFILDDNKNLYQRKHDNNSLFQSGVYSNVPMYISGDVKFDKGWAGPWLSGLTLFYDKTNGALYVGSDFGSVLKLSFTNVFPGMPGNYTFIDNMDKELIHVGNVKQGRYASAYYLIYKDETTGYFAQNIQLVHQGTFCMAIHMGEKEFGEDKINDNTVFCQLERKSNYMFFSGGNDNKTLYLYEHTTSLQSEYYTFDSPIKTISHDLSNASNNVLMVGLENGDIVFLGITFEDLINPDARFKQKVELGEGVPLSTFYKCGYAYSQY